MQHWYMQNAQQDAWTQCPVRRGAARRDGQGNFNAASDFSPFVPIFFPRSLHAGEKSSMSPKKRGLREKFGHRFRTAGLERAGMAGRDGGKGRAGMGAGAGPGRAGGGGRACIYIKTCVGIGSNAVSELYTEGKSGIFALIFSERYLIFPSFSRIFPEGKILRI